MRSPNSLQNEKVRLLTIATKQLSSISLAKQALLQTIKEYQSFWSGIELPLSVKLIDVIILNKILTNYNDPNPLLNLKTAILLLHAPNGLTLLETAMLLDLSENETNMLYNQAVCEFGLVHVPQMREQLENYYSIPKKSLKPLYLALSVFFSLIFLSSAGLLILRLLDSKKAITQMNTLTQAQTSSIESIPPSISNSPSSILPQYHTLYSTNNDLIGWIEIPDTMLNLPVMYTPSEPEYYLHRLFDKSYSLYGVPFLDGFCSPIPRSTNLILHGHHMTDGTMFSTLSNYKNQAYFKSHPIINFDTIWETAQYQIISVFLSVYDENNHDPNLYYNFINAKDKQDFDRFISNVKATSIYDTGYTAQYGDQLLTMITCDYQTANGRINLVAKKISP